MLRVKLPKRPDGHASTLTDSFVSQNNFWVEGSAIQITPTEAESLRQDARRLVVCFNQAMDYVTSTPSVMERFAFSQNKRRDRKLHQLIKADWEQSLSKTYPLDRWDIVWSGTEPFKLLERNTGYLGLITGTGPTQEDYIHWLKGQNGYEDVQSFGSLQKSVTRSFREAAEERGIFASARIGVLGEQRTVTSDPGMTQAAHLMTKWLRGAGFNADILRADFANFNQGRTVVSKWVSPSKINHSGTELDGFEVNGADVIFHVKASAVFLYYGFNNYAQSVSNYSTKRNPIPIEETKSLQPYWTLLATHKGMLPVLHELFPTNPNILPAYWGDVVMPGQKHIVKHVVGCQGLDSYIRSATGQPLASRQAKRGELRQLKNTDRFITQAYANTIQTTSTDYDVFNLFTANGEPAALGVRTAPGPFVGGSDTKTNFIPVIVRNASQGVLTPEGPR